jgi:hypothetical protein
MSCKILNIVLAVAMLVATKGKAESHFTEGGVLSLFNQTIGYQLGYSTNSESFMHAIDFNGMAIILNYGCQYQFNQGTKLFVGLGIANAFQLQYGYAINAHSNLLRIRSDWEIGIGVKKPVDYPVSTVGLFYEKGFSGDYKGYTIGVTVALSVWDIKHYSKKMIGKK